MVRRYVPNGRKSRQLVYDCPTPNETVVLMYVPPVPVRVMVKLEMLVTGVMAISPVYSFK